MTNVVDAGLLAVVEPVVDEARRVIAGRIADGGYLPTISRWTSLGRLDSGFPRVSFSVMSSEKPDYQYLFSPEGRDYGRVAWTELPSLPSLFEYVRSRPELSRRITFVTSDENADEREVRWFEIGVATVPLSLTDRLVHLYGPGFTHEQMLSVYSQIETGILADRLPVELWAPLVLTRFEGATEVALADRISIRRIPDELQLARVPDHVFGGAVHELVMQAATHAVVITGLEMPNENRWVLPTNQPLFYPVADIDRVLDATRIAVPVATGYAQVFLRPVGWAHSFVADLPSVMEGAMLRRYPPRFDERGWLDVPEQCVSGDDLGRVARIHTQLATAAARLRLAARRLSNAALRSDERCVATSPMRSSICASRWNLR